MDTVIKEFKVKQLNTNDPHMDTVIKESKELIKGLINTKRVPANAGSLWYKSGLARRIFIFPSRTDCKAPCAVDSLHE